MNNEDFFYDVAKAFSEIGLSVKTVFPDIEIARELYSGHRWYVMRKNDLTVVHAIPKKDAIETSFWEMWYGSSDTEPEHDVLFRRTPPVKHHRIYEVRPGDSDINPPQVCGAIWYVVEQAYPLGWALKIF
ncbi:MAG: hypothetical protein PQJ47_11670 [Sphaerochaetaceae bacterium]|nr:hypothetical protein [Sphaerochaetaceae bacterium]